MEYIRLYKLTDIMINKTLTFETLLNTEKF